MLQQLQKFASRSCTNIQQLRQQLRQQQKSETSNLPVSTVDPKENHEKGTSNVSAAQMRHLIEELRIQLSK